MKKALILNISRLLISAAFLVLFSFLTAAVIVGSASIENGMLAVLLTLPAAATGSISFVLALSTANAIVEDVKRFLKKRVK